MVRWEENGINHYGVILSIITNIAKVEHRTVDGYVTTNKSLEILTKIGKK